MFTIASRPALSLVLAAAVLAGSAAAQLPNDDCATAQSAADGLTVGTNAGALTGPDPIPTCSSGFGDVWYIYNATCTGNVTASLCAPGTANFDSVMSAWSGSCGCLTELACNDDFCSFRSQVTFPAVAGNFYYISIAGFDGGAGTFTLNITCAPQFPPPVIPSNDNCANAIPVTDGSITTGTNINASTGGGGGCPGDLVGDCSLGANDVWYVFTAACTGPYEARTCLGITGFDTVVTVFDGTLGCGNLVQVACNDDNFCQVAGQGSSSIAQWNANAGTTYYVSVGGFLGIQGNFDLQVGLTSTLTLNITNTPAGTLGYTLGGGPFFGVAYTAITGNAGNFPNGAVFGIDISPPEIISQITFGYPFITFLGACGESAVPPLGPLPPGFTIYAVSVAAPIGVTVPSHVSAPVTATVQ
jgi:hypothetical protein